MIGSSLSHYKITAKLGQGGMGEVYRATDENLGRDVAIKVLPNEVAHDTERLARFKREAQLLGSLNHTGIAAIHGLEEADGRPFLVLELVEGEDLSERLKRGPIPVDEATSIAEQIAEALEEAHEHGIVHRDLKPANVKLTPGGRVKVLDFGLAKAYAGDAADGSAPDVSQSPTMSAQATQAGVILGTAAYMSPEQAKGQRVDRRADIWAFGVVLHEMLTGARLFASDSVAETLAGVLKSEIDLRTVPDDVSPALRRLLGRCLERDQRRRLRDIGEARVALETLRAGEDPEGAPTVTAACTLRGLVPWLGAAAAAGIALGFLSARAIDVESVEPRSVRFGIDPAVDEGEVDWIRLSPDGRRLVYATGTGPLRLRNLDAFESRSLPGTDGATMPFWSPGGDFIGFYADDKLRKVSMAGGDPITLCDAPGNSPGAAWGPDDDILFSPTWTGTGLWRVGAGGGTPEAVTTPDPAQGETGHFWVEFLPGAEAALFTVFGGRGMSDSSIAVLDLRTREYQVLFRGAKPLYLNTGHVVFFRAGAYHVIPFDAEKRVATGEARPFPADARPLDPLGTNASQLDVAGGVVASLPGAVPGAVSASQFVWVARDGSASPLGFEADHMKEFTLSPDGRRIAATVYSGGEYQIWVYDLELATRQRLTREGQNFNPRWHPDGRHVVFGTQSRGNFDVMQVPVDGSAEPRLLRGTDADEGHLSWSPDGSVAVFTLWSPTTGRDLWSWADDGGEARPVLATVAAESQARFSADGRWLAYQSGTSLVVAAWPALDRRVQIASRFTGSRWSGVSSELFYVADGQLHAARFGVREGVLRLLDTAALFDVPEGSTASGEDGDFDVAPDAQRFLFQVQVGEPSAQQIHVTVGDPGDLLR